MKGELVTTPARPLVGGSIAVLGRLASGGLSMRIARPAGGLVTLDAVEARWLASGNSRPPGVLGPVAVRSRFCSPVSMMPGSLTLASRQERPDVHVGLSLRRGHALSAGPRSGGRGSHALMRQSRCLRG